MFVPSYTRLQLNKMVMNTSIFGLEVSAVLRSLADMSIVSVLGPKIFEEAFHNISLNS